MLTLTIGVREPVIVFFVCPVPRIVLGPSLDTQAMFCWIELLHLEEWVIGPWPQQVISDYSWPIVSTLFAHRPHTLSEAICWGVPLSNSLKGFVLANSSSHIIPYSCIQWTDWELRVSPAGRTQQRDQRRWSLWAADTGLVPVGSLSSLSQL